MSSALRLIVVGIVLVSFTACTTLQPIEDFSPSKIQRRVHVGDRVSIVWQGDARRYDVKVTGVDAAALHGVTDSGKAYMFPYERIRSIEVERSHGGVAVAVLVTVAVVAFIILLFRSISFENGGGGESSGSSGSES